MAVGFPDGQTYGRGEPQLPIGETRPPAREGRVIFFTYEPKERSLIHL